MPPPPQSVVQPVVSNLARKFDFLQERAQRRPVREANVETSGDAAKKTDIGHLKEFYLQRLARTDPGAASRLSLMTIHEASDDAQPQASGQHVARPTFKLGAPKDIEDLEVMCNNCFNLIRSSEASNCTGDPSACPVACRNESSDPQSEKPQGQIPVIDLKLKKLRLALEARLRDSSSKVNVMRHLTQLRYHIDTAAKWAPGCSEIGALSDHTVQQVKQLTATSRVLAPAVYIFSKRIENVVVQKERELRRALVHTSSTTKGINGIDAGLREIEHSVAADSIADVNSVVSELDSDCGTQYGRWASGASCRSKYAETVLSQDGHSADVGNVQDANDYINLKNEDEQRRWFYAQTLTVKLALSDKTRARKTLISDLYAKVREEGVPIDGWVQWIRAQLMPEGADATAELGHSAQGSPAGSPAAANGEDLDRTTLVPAATPMTYNAAKLNESYPLRYAAPRATSHPAAPFAPPIRQAAPIAYVRR